MLVAKTFCLFGFSMLLHTLHAECIKCLIEKHLNIHLTMQSKLITLADKFDRLTLPTIELAGYAVVSIHKQRILDFREILMENVQNLLKLTTEFFRMIIPC